MVTNLQPLSTWSSRGARKTSKHLQEIYHEATGQNSFSITNYQSQHLPGFKLSSTKCSIVITPIELWNYDRSEDGNPDGKVRRKKRFSEKSGKMGQANEEDDEGEIGAENVSLSSNTTRIKNKLFEDNTDNLDAITSSSKRR